MPATTPMTTRQAIAYAKSVGADPDKWNEAEWRACEAALVAAGLCPRCLSAAESLRSPLNAWQAGDYWNHSGRECPNCNEFFICGEQPEYAPDTWMGDADPGL